VQFTAGTGINPWWRYQEENVPGGGRLMINVGSGNMLLQYDDLGVPHKGIALAFRRTYNSQSQHDVNGTDGSAPNLFARVRSAARAPARRVGIRRRRRAYFPDGSSSQTPAERSFGVSSTFTYDLDGNVVTVTQHHDCIAGQSCADGTTQK
jgi:hypothetical protein